MFWWQKLKLLFTVKTGANQLADLTVQKKTRERVTSTARNCSFVWARNFTKSVSAWKTTIDASSASRNSSQQLNTVTTQSRIDGTYDELGKK